MGTEPHKEFPTEESQMAMKHLKCSTFLVIREAQIKISLRFFLIQISMAKIPNSGHKTCMRMSKKRYTPPLLVGLKAVTTPWESGGSSENWK
jgi:hypothetical protein